MADCSGPKADTDHNCNEMMQFLLRLQLPFLLIFPVLAYGDSEAPRYYLQDCVVKIGLKWPSKISPEVKTDVLRDAREHWKKAMLSPEYPLFNMHYARDPDHYAIYFAKDCENRREHSERLLRSEIAAKVKDFPGYYIVTDYKVGSDGVTPSGWWIDH
jgi:hypothetical protein